MDETMENKFTKYEKVMTSFGKFFDQDELSSILDRKADVDLVNNINRERASLGQLLQVKNQLETLNDRIKHLCVISGEIVDNLDP